MGERIPIALATGRLALGTGAWLAPTRSARALQLPSSGRPESHYLLRIYGIRAIALGLSTLLAPAGPQRGRAQRIGLLVDIADTLAAPASRLASPARQLSQLLTGTYATLGALALARSPRVTDITQVTKRPAPPTASIPIDEPSANV